MSPVAALVEALEPLRSDPAHTAVLFDIDGTLAPIVRHADEAHVPEPTRALLSELARRYGLVACVSGRRATTARQIVSIGTIAYVGSHGGELLRAGATRTELDPELAAWSERVRAFAASAFTPAHQRLRIRTEDKGAIAAFHWRGAPDEEAAAGAVREIAARAEQEGFVVHWGRKVLEVRPPITFDKGLGIAALLGDGGARPAADAQGPGTGAGARGPAPGRSDRPRAAVYVGDDSTDLDAFRMLRELVRTGALEHAVCVAVGSDEAPPELLQAADLTIDGPDGVRALLEALL